MEVKTISFFIVAWQMFSKYHIVVSSLSIIINILDSFASFASFQLHVKSISLSQKLIFSPIQAIKWIQKERFTFDEHFLYDSPV
jgi:hypothetical protein